MTDGTPKLRMLEGRLAGKVLLLEGQIVIGRQPGVKLRLADAKVSREHTKVFPQSGQWYVVDLNSRNGTLVNDAPITKRVLHDGDEITIGETRMRFEAPPPPEVEKAPTVQRRPAVREVIDLREKPEAAPAGAISADMIQVKERALQFSKVSGKKKVSPLFDDLGQRPMVYQFLMILVVLVLAGGFLYLGLLLAGVFGGGSGG